VPPSRDDGATLVDHILVHTPSFLVPPERGSNLHRKWLPQLRDKDLQMRGAQWRFQL